LAVVTPFDPWRSPHCTCPRKYSVSPYTGCSHRCLYCYITSYIPNAFSCRPKKSFIERLSKDIKRITPSLPISMANSSDPYAPIESELRLTRKALQLLLPEGFKVLLITKSSLVANDRDVIAQGNCSVSISITTMDDELARMLEPSAPPPSKRLSTLGALTSSGIPCSVRIDPLIPGINDDVKMLEGLVAEVASAGASHLVAATYKAKIDSFNRLLKAFPECAEKLRNLYWAIGEAKGKARYLPFEVRINLLKALKAEAEKRGLTFSTCREGCEDLKSGDSCDGSHLIPSRLFP